MGEESESEYILDDEKCEGKRRLLKRASSPPFIFSLSLYQKTGDVESESAIKAGLKRRRRRV